jgi:microtubule-associated protein-like 1/2
MASERMRNDVYLDDRYFDEEDEMGERLRLGEPGTHRGKRVTFYRNGDSHYKGLQTSISKKQFGNIESLIIWLNEKIPTTCGVRYIFSLGTGQQIRDIDDIHVGGKYVVSSSRSVIQVNYGKGDNLYWRNKALSAGKIRRAEIDLFFRRDQNRPQKSHSYPGSRAESNRTTQLSKYPSGVKPRLLTIRNNLHRDTVQKVILNPKTTQNFDEMIKDIGSMLQVPGEEKFVVTALYTAKPPYKKVFSNKHVYVYHTK